MARAPSGNDAETSEASVERLDACRQRVIAANASPLGDQVRPRSSAQTLAQTIDEDKRRHRHAAGDAIK
ncbi:MAG: hypothetical protein EA417_15340 [Gammaproteobacteria bacterium]|nr:MAG: hypothetical protein EA417_15340 [Gammaproteobacteria bacterium]